MTNVIGLYDDAGKAHQAISELRQVGLEEDDIELMGEAQKQDRQLEQHLAEFGLSQQYAHLYAEAVRAGKAVLYAHAPDDQADRILEILDKNGARDIDDAAQEFSGRQEAGGQRQGASHQETQAISSAEEKLSVGKKQVLQGGMRISKTVSEKPVEQSVSLKEEKIDVQRQGGGRKLSPEEARQAFQEETREFTETREVPQVRKEAQETGRVEVRKTSQEHEEKVRGTVRKSDVRTERIDPRKSGE